MSKPIDFFWLIFTEDLLYNIKEWTNERGRSRTDNSQRRKQKKAMWRDLSFIEMKAKVVSIEI